MSKKDEFFLDDFLEKLSYFFTKDLFGQPILPEKTFPIRGPFYRTETLYVTNMKTGFGTILTLMKFYME